MPRFPAPHHLGLSSPQTGLSLDEAAHVDHKALLAEIASKRHASMGDAPRAAQSSYADSGAFLELLAIHHLFGDPATKIR